MNRYPRSSLILISLLATIARPHHLKADDEPKVKPHEAGELPKPKAIRRPKVTPHMKVTLTVLVGGQEIFRAKTVDFELEVGANPDKSKDRTKNVKPVTLNAKDLAKLPGGEFSYDDVMLSSPDSLYAYSIKFDELHSPGTKNMKNFTQALQNYSLDRSTPVPSLRIDVEVGGSISIDGVVMFNAYGVSGTKEGLLLENIGVRGGVIVSLN